MARTAYWIANPTSTWAAGTLSGAEIAAGLMADGATAANVQCHTLAFSFRESMAELAWAAKAPPEL